MLKKLPALSKEQALVAYTGVQFLDYGFQVDENFSFSRTFLEKLEERPNGRYHVLRPIERNKNAPGAFDHEFVDSETGDEVTSTATYPVQLKTALEAYDGTWLPAPFL